MANKQTLTALQTVIEHALRIELNKLKKEQEEKLASLKSKCDDIITRAKQNAEREVLKSKLSAEKFVANESIDDYSGGIHVILNTERGTDRFWFNLNVIGGGNFKYTKIITPDNKLQEEYKTVSKDINKLSYLMNQRSTTDIVDLVASEIYLRDKPFDIKPAVERALELFKGA